MISFRFEERIKPTHCNNVVIVKHRMNAEKKKKKLRQIGVWAVLPTHEVPSTDFRGGKRDGGNFEKRQQAIPHHCNNHGAFTHHNPPSFS